MYLVSLSTALGQCPQKCFCISNAYKHAPLRRRLRAGVSHPRNPTWHNNLGLRPMSLIHSSIPILNGQSDLAHTRHSFVIQNAMSSGKVEAVVGDVRNEASLSRDVVLSV